GCAYNHSVVAIPRILGSARPYHVDESQYTVTERSKVNRPRPDAQAKLPAGFPSLRTRDQRTLNNHLEGDVDARGSEHNNGANGIFQEQPGNRDERRQQAGNQQGDDRYAGSL